MNSCHIKGLAAVLMLFSAIIAFGQAKKPTVMVLPADVWCIQNGYFTESDHQGRRQKLPDYERALQENADLYNVIAKIGELMSDQGFPLKDMSTEIKNVNRTMVEDDLTQSSSSGSSLAETPLERLSRRAKADILVEVQWSVNSIGPKNSVTYTIRGLDAYTSKQVAAAQGTSAQSMTASIPLLLEKSVVENIDNFTAQLMAHFEDLLANGREVIIRVQTFDNGSGLSMESEFDGEELTDVIDNWMNDNTVNHRYNLSDAGENSLLFEQVRIPLYKENGSPMDTRQFATQLRKFLNKAPYGITSKIITKGLGQANLILGEK